MRRLIILLALIASSAFFLSAPATASAANCTGANIGGVVWSGGKWKFDVALVGCTGTSGASLMGYDVSNWTHIQDTRDGSIHNNLSLTLSYLGGASSYYWNGPSVNIWGAGCGAPPFYVAKRFGWRIRNSVGNTWGPWHQAGPAYQWLC